MEDGGRPSEDGLQDQSSNHRTLRGDEIPGGEQSGKMRSKFRQVWIRKTNESEPLMRHRNACNAIETRLLQQAWDPAWKEPAYGPIQAFMQNVGTWRPDAEGDIQGAVKGTNILAVCFSASYPRCQ